MSDKKPRRKKESEYYRYEKNSSGGPKKSSSLVGKVLLFLVIIFAILAFIALFFMVRQPQDVSLVENTEEAVELESEDEQEEEGPDLLMPADFPHMIAGGLSKGELEFVLSYVPDQVLKDGLNEQNIAETLSRMISGDLMNETELFGKGKSNDYSLEEMQRFLDSFSQWSLKKKKGPYEIQGEDLSMDADKLGILASANITEAKLDKNKMEISYELDYMGGDPEIKKPFHAEKKAILARKGEEPFRIEDIIEEKKTEIHPEEKAEKAQEKKDEDNPELRSKMTPPGHVSNKGKNAEQQKQKVYGLAKNSSSKEPLDSNQEKANEEAELKAQGYLESKNLAIEKVINGNRSGQKEYQLAMDPSAQRTGENHYALLDIDGDGREELLLEADAYVGGELKSYVQIYKIEEEEGMYRPSLLQGNFSAIEIRIPQDGQGGLFLLDSTEHMNEKGLYIMMISGSQLIIPAEPQRVLMEDSPEMSEFINFNPEIPWRKI